MKLVRLTIGILPLACCAAPSAVGDAIRNCAWCHGTSVQGFSTAPRLAGQRPAYVMNQLRDFRHHTRDNPFSRQYMWGAAENLSFPSAHALAGYLAMIPPKAANDGHIQIAAVGRAIYQDGIPDLNIASCVACHGPNAEGVRQIPRLGGLSHGYLKARLRQWGEGFHITAEAPMPGVAMKLGANEIEALASYLSFVRYPPF